MAEKRREAEGWAAMARDQGWYEPDDEVDAVLPYVNRDLGWDDLTWRANEHSFGLLLDVLEPGMRVLEVGAAKCWGAQHVIPSGCTYVATDILADPNIGLGRGAFYEERVGPFLRVQADGESLPFADASFDVTYCVATLHHALDLGAMAYRARDEARRTRAGAERGHARGVALGRRARPGGGARLWHQRARTRSTPTSGRSRCAGLLVTRVEQADGYDEPARPPHRRPLLRLPLVGRSAATWFTQSCYGYQGASLVARNLACEGSIVTRAALPRRSKNQGLTPRTRLPETCRVSILWNNSSTGGPNGIRTGPAVECSVAGALRKKPCTWTNPAR